MANMFSGIVQLVGSRMNRRGLENARAGCIEGAARTCDRFLLEDTQAGLEEIHGYLDSRWQNPGAIVPPPGTKVAVEDGRLIIDLRDCQP